jgi:acyl-coenzyme A synthetase/AMP-(fatty) acid ligase
MDGLALAALLGLTEDSDTAPAIIDSETVLTRGQLLLRASRRAAQISEMVPPDCRVGLMDSQDHHAFVNLLAGVLAGRSVAMVPQEPANDTQEAAAKARCAVLLNGDDLSAVNRPLNDDPLADPRLGVRAFGSPEAIVLYTSGTTSEPRGVRLSQRNVGANLTAMLRLTPSWTSEDRFGMVLALTHSFGLSMTFLSLARRAPIVLLGGGLPSRKTAETVEASRVTVLACVPYYLRLLGRRGLSIGDNFAPALHSIYLAGGGISDQELDAVLVQYNGERFLMYGFTEATARVAVRRSGDGAPPNSVGLPLPGTNVDIVSEDGDALPTGQQGRIRASSPSLMIGYLGSEPRVPGTAFTTTDLGRLDEFGNLFVTGREAEMLNFRGNRVSAVAVEARVMELEGVQDARLVPDARDEDAQCVLSLITTPGSDHHKLRREVLRVVVPRGMVREVEFVDHLGVTRSGKPLRRV